MQTEFNLEEIVEQPKVSPRAIKYLRDKAKIFQIEDPTRRDEKRFREKIDLVTKKIEHNSKIKHLTLDMQGTTIFPSDIKTNKSNTITLEHALAKNKQIFSMFINGPGFTTPLQNYENIFAHIYNQLSKEKGTDYDRVIGELYKTLPGLDDGFYHAIASQLSTDLTDLQPNDIISNNRVWFAQDPETGKRIVFKLTDNLDKAQRAVIAGNKDLDFIPKNYGEGLIHVGPYVIYAQEFVNLNQETNYKDFFENLAIAHNGFSAIAESLRPYTPASTDKLEEILRKPLQKEGIDSRKIFDIYAQRTGELSEEEHTVAIHSDLKEDNRGGKYIIDWEGMKKGNPAIDIALPLVQDRVNPALWHKAITAYTNKMQQLNPNLAGYLKETLSRDISNYAIIPAVKELSGLYSRPMGEKEKSQAQTLVNYLRTI